MSIIKIGSHYYKRISEKEFYKYRDKYLDYNSIGILFTFNDVDAETIAYFKVIKMKTKKDLNNKKLKGGIENAKKIH